MLIQFHQIQGDKTHPRPVAPASARRCSSACDGRNPLSPAAPSLPFKRGKLAQALVDILFVGAALLFVSTAAVAIAGSAFILFFVRT